jgi:hypothetical protein
VNIPQEELSNNPYLAELVEDGDFRAMLVYWDPDLWEQLLDTKTPKDLLALAGDALAAMQQVGDYDHCMGLICGLQDTVRDQYAALAQRYAPNT